MNLHEAILAVLKDHVGKENRISREYLRLDVSFKLRYTIGFKVGDREMRAAIEELRRDHPIGALICSSSGVGGYWLAKDFDEILASYNEERRRAMSLMFTMRQRRDRAHQHFFGQMELGL